MQGQQLPLETILTSFELVDLKGTPTVISLVSIEGINSFLRQTQGDLSVNIQWGDLIGAQINGDILKITTMPILTQRRMFKKTTNRVIQYLSFKAQNSSADIPAMQFQIQTFARQKYTKDYSFKVSQNIPEKMLIFVNPHSGKGQAMQIFLSIKEVFESAGIQCEVVKTLHRLHCHDYIHQINGEDLFSYSGIVSVSGDGTPHEIINALMNRPDFERCMEQLTIGAIQGGSGNALPTTLCHLSNEPKTPQSSAYLIAKNFQRRIDIMEFTRERSAEEVQDDQHRIFTDPKLYCFLSLSWTYVSDIDLGSESLRFLGEMRFEVYGLWRLLFLTKYPAELYFSNDLKYCHHPQNLRQHKQPIEPPLFSPSQEISQYPEQLLQQPEQLDYSPLPPLSESLPDTFSTTSSQSPFTFFYLSNLSWVSEKYESFPLTKPDDQLFDLVYLQENQGKCQMVKTALALNEGSFFDRKTESVAKGYNLNYSKVSAVRLVPHNPKQSGYFSIDGERYKAEALQGIVISSAFKVFSK